jgi:pyruvate kinase
MIARGDLGVEIPFWTVPEVSRRMVRLCREYNKTVIMATQMLSSMEHSEFPTRSEISDVANAAYWRCDSTMTSEETTVGEFPVQTTAAMAKILENADIDGARYDSLWTSKRKENQWSESVVQLAELNEAAAIVIFTHGGTNAREISARKSDLPIIVITKEAISANQCCLLRGVFPIYNEKMFEDGDYKSALAEFGIKSGAIVIVTDNDVKLEKL